VLTRTDLRCYDAPVSAAVTAQGDHGDTEQAHGRKEKGRVALRDVRLVERVTLRDQGRAHAFQVGHMPKGSPHVQLLYVNAKSEAEREEWIQLLRNLCRHNAHLADQYHPGQWSAVRWACCGETSRAAIGCQSITWTPRQTKLDPVPPLPASATLATVAAEENGDDVLDEDEVTNRALSSAVVRAQQVNANGGKVVIAVYPFTAIEPGDLSLAKGEEYVVLDDSQEHWWQVQNAAGQVGFIPSNYVKEKDALGLQHFDW